MKHKKKWPKRIFLLVTTLILCGAMLLGSYVYGYEKELMTYQASLAKLPEVTKVLEISKYKGVEEYYVAKVILTNETEQYYFIKDNIVVYNIVASELLSIEQLEKRVNELVSDALIKHYYLGIHEEKPIYEILLSSQGRELYLIVNAIDGSMISKVTL
ncbi:MAG: hypothetical protein ACRCST_11730 [Turicibacter sp.]